MATGITGSGCGEIDKFDKDFEMVAEQGHGGQKGAAGVFGGISNYGHCTWGALVTFPELVCYWCKIDLAGGIFAEPFNNSCRMQNPKGGDKATGKGKKDKDIHAAVIKGKGKEKSKDQGKDDERTVLARNHAALLEVARASRSHETLVSELEQCTAYEQQIKEEFEKDKIEETKQWQVDVMEVEADKKEEELDSKAPSTHSESDNDFEWTEVGENTAGKKQVKQASTGSASRVRKYVDKDKERLDKASRKAAGTPTAVEDGKTRRIEQVEGNDETWFARIMVKGNEQANAGRPTEQQLQATSSSNKQDVAATSGSNGDGNTDLVAQGSG